LREPYLGVAAVAEEAMAIGRRRAAVVIDQRRAASTVVVATDRVESDGDLESFEIKSETTQGGLLFIGSKISAAVLV
jgi:hypothetical protein